MNKDAYVRPEIQTEHLGPDALCNCGSCDLRTSQGLPQALGGGGGGGGGGGSFGIGDFGGSSGFGGSGGYGGSGSS
jgi:hypothetical protein